MNDYHPHASSAGIAGPLAHRIISLFSIAAISILAVYLALHCFYSPWTGDIGQHIAAVASLYESLIHPRHEALPVAGTLSEVHTPYMVTVAAFGRLLQVTPYRILQIVGVLNVVAYLGAVRYYFKTFSLYPESWLPAVLFLFVSLWARNTDFLWSSETSLETLRFIQAYPSLFAWTAALLLFSWQGRYLRDGRIRYLCYSTALIPVLLLSHTLTAGWVLGVSACVSATRLTSRGEQRIRAAQHCGAMGLGCLIALGWPYFSLITGYTRVGIREGSWFSGTPFNGMLSLYLLGLAAGTALYIRGRHCLLILQFLVTYGALQLFRWYGFDYGERFVFFQAFFLQVLAAEYAALQIDAAMKPGTTPARCLRLVFPALLLCVTILTAVMKDRRLPLSGFGELLQREPSLTAYERRTKIFSDLLSRKDVVMMPAEHLVFDVAAASGARAVAALWSYRVPDYFARRSAATRFFTPGVPCAERTRLLSKYGATAVILTSEKRSLRSELIDCFGPPLGSDTAIDLFRPSPNHSIRPYDMD